MIISNSSLTIFMMQVYEENEPGTPIVRVEYFRPLSQFFFSHLAKREMEENKAGNVVDD
jgi:hypothetical protein